MQITQRTKVSFLNVSSILCIAFGICVISYNSALLQCAKRNKHWKRKTEFGLFV